MPSRRLRLVISLLVCFALVGVVACTSGTREPQRLILASTTSTEDSGLFSVLVPAFEAEHPEYRVEVIAVGTGEALALGRRGDADVVLVHSTEDEERFVLDGHGLERRDVMYNDFVVLGPDADPVDARSVDSVSAALREVSQQQATFVSRADDSGTHKRERALWEEAGVEPVGAWYLATGQGMGETLKVASEKQGYVLTDRATYLTMRGALDLAIVREGEERLRNQYGVIVVADARNLEGATAFAEWVCSTYGQAVIGSFGVEEFGFSLFEPNAR